MKKEIKLYNVLFPLWLLVWFPSWYWILLIPLNYIVDTLVTWLSLRKQDAVADRKSFCLKHTWKLCLAGFVSDFIGSLILLGVEALTYVFSGPAIMKISNGILMNPFENIWSLLICIVAVAASGFAIFLLDRWILKKAGLAVEQAKKTAMWLAIITAPYLFLVPTELLYPY